MSDYAAWRGEAAELIYDSILDELADVPDEDSIRAAFVLRSFAHEIRAFRRPRPEIIAGLEALADREITAGELRAMIRRARAGLG